MADSDFRRDGIRLVKEVTCAGPEQLDSLLSENSEPFVVRGLVRDWPLVREGLRSPAAARAYLRERALDRPFTYSTSHHPDGRIFYDETMAVNFATAKGSLDDIFDRIDATEEDRDLPAIYLSSIDLNTHFKTVASDHRVPLGDRRCLESIWIGTRTRVAAHNDFPNNLACCAVGRRRFTLFPPDQFANLYLGPIDNTPAGRPVSMADPDRPDFEAFPRYRQALKKAQLAELDPGDAIFIPSLWYHQVEGLCDFNILVNFWWRPVPAFLGQPGDALYHAILAVRDLPPDQKQVWKAMFDHYVFDDPSRAADHLPRQARGILGPLDAELAGRLRAYLLRALNQ